MMHYVVGWVYLSFMVLLSTNVVISNKVLVSSKFSSIMIWMTAILWVSYTCFLMVLTLVSSWVLALGIILVLFFSASNLWMLLIWFEMSLLPIILIIIAFGGQSARFPAALYLLVYTMCFSLPSLGLILTSNISMNLMVVDFSWNWFMGVLLSLLFFVKIPLFGLHLWLPKAHVESPTLGSMILAGALLKMGVFGFYQVSKWACIKINLMWVLVGSGVASLFACLQSDLKRAIAFSSVAHLNLGLAAMLTLSALGESSILLLSLVHGVISSILFYLVGMASKINGSRLLFYLKLNVLFVWLLSLSFNLSLPPSPSFWAEYFSVFGLSLNHLVNLVPVLLGALSLAWFSILIWLSLKFQPVQKSSGQSLVQLSHLWMIFMLWVNLMIFI